MLECSITKYFLSLKREDNSINVQLNYKQVHFIILYLYSVTFTAFPLCKWIFHWCYKGQLHQIKPQP